MAGLISTGIAGFLSSAKFTGKQIANKAGKLVPEVVSTFVSGLSGWMMTAKGDLECRSIYARDKFITNEYVYNRIRVTEDEEIISSSMKILSAINNDNGTWTVYPDLREGDVNPLSGGDLVAGYYHNPANSGVIYAVQKMIVNADPDSSQGIIVTCEEGSVPYPHMIIVRVGNTTDLDRQSFIRISSRSNCQYFYDGINSWAAYDDPEHVRCALGKADVGLIPAWAVKAIGNVKKWFGLIADGVILRGTFILQSSNKTIESELEGVNTTITDIETRFEVKEGQIAASVKTAESYAKTAVDNANFADEAANAAHGIFTGVKESEAIILLTSKGIESKVSEIRKEVDNATGVLQDISEKESSINHTAEGINTKVSEVKVYSESAAASASAAADSATAAESAKTISVEKSAEAKQTADGFQNTVTEVTKRAVADAVAGADAVIEEKVSTQVTQSAREWKVEVMGADADGNPNSVIAAINATPEGIEIEGKKVKITGELLAEIIKASGLNINDKFVVTTDSNGNAQVKLVGDITATSGKIGGMDIVGNSLRGVQATFGKHYYNIDHNASREVIVERIAEQQTYLFKVITEEFSPIIRLPSAQDLVLKGLDEYCFELTLVTHIDNIYAVVLSLKNDTGIYLNGAKLGIFMMAKGEVIKLMYFENNYYVVSNSKMLHWP